MKRFALVVALLSLVACGGPEDPAAGEDTGLTDTGFGDADVGDVGADLDTGVDAPSDVGGDTADVGSDVTDTGSDTTDAGGDPDTMGDTMGDVPGDTDAGMDTGMDVETGMDADASDVGDDTMDASDTSDTGDVVIMPTDGPEIVHTGTDGLLLRGDLLLPDSVLEDGELLIVDGLIACVAADCSGDPAAATATIVETHGLVSPGLVDAHNHLPYNFLPEWYPPDDMLYDNRYQWADEPSYEEFILPFTAHRNSNSHFCPAAQWGELRSLLHGTTTMMGQSFERTCTQGLVRNADHAHDLGPDHMRTSIGSVRDINDADAADYVTSFATDTTRFAVHMQEGVAEDHVLEEFDSFAGRDPRANRHAGTSLLNETSILIHSISLTDTQLDEAAAAGAHIVWSPSSNLALYGETLDIEAVVSRGINVGMGPDWTPSGEDDMLAELDFAWRFVSDSGITAVTPELLWRMATGDGAEVVGLGDRIGRLEVGYHADVTVFALAADDPYLGVVEAQAQDVVLVLIEGEPAYGVDALTPLTSGCERLDVCGDDRFVCRPADATFATIGDIEQELIDILEGTGFPAEEQYGRGDELLPLVACD